MAAITGALLRWPTLATAAADRLALRRVVRLASHPVLFAKISHLFPGEYLDGWVDFWQDVTFAADDFKAKTKFLMPPTFSSAIPRSGDGITKGAARKSIASENLARVKATSLYTSPHRRPAGMKTRLHSRT
ncbi:hypothetical protein [Massilia sp. S19_KUP03_FR1]|uniref:hypothetical protein n=1 Tax=Massilia sp. S19_KUP03_FR1 TaxID=3025503 RepID=UPI002FCD7F51